MYQQKWRRWIADQGCQFGFFEARIWNSGFFWTPLTFLGNQKARQNSSGKTLSELHIHYKSLLTRVRDHAGYKEYWNDFTVALKIIDVIYKKQMQDSVITGKENASKDWNCTIISLMFLTSFNIYFVFEYACFTWICLKTGIWLFLAYWGQFLFFLVKTGWQPCCWSLELKFQDWLLHWLKLWPIFLAMHIVFTYITLFICNVR